MAAFKKSVDAAHNAHNAMKSAAQKAEDAVRGSLKPKKK
jgi:hypothetical protein